MKNAYQQLEALFKQQYHLDHLNNIANWDEAVMMPQGGGQARSDALSTLHGIQHQLLTSSKTRDLLAAAEENTDLNRWQTANLKLMSKSITNANLLPNDLVQAITKATMDSEQQWRVLRGENNWTSYMPYLKNAFDLILEATQYRARHWKIKTYDVLLDDYNPNFNQESIDALFTPLKEKIPTLIQRIISHQSESAITPLNGSFSQEQQYTLAKSVMSLLCFNFQHGRLDTAHHPFCGGSPEDIRITTRYDEQDFLSSLMAVCHETGHAKYEQNLPKDWISQPVGHAMGMALHESQSLLIEMQICRSKEFIHCIETLIPPNWKQSEAVNTQNLFALATKVKPSLIRVEADEVTYPMHIILRYEIERELFNGKITIQDLPEAWNHYMQKYLNINTSGDYRNGVMQDVHWPSGAFGYFPAYTLGRLIAAQLFHAMSQAIPNIHDNIQEGKLGTIFEWLEKHIHSQGQVNDTETLMQNATGATLSPDYFISHIENRYLQ